MRPNLITRLKEEWNNLDPVDPLRGLIADAIEALAEQPAISAGPITPAMMQGPTPEQKAQMVEVMSKLAEQPALPFGIGGGLVAIKTLLSRDPCAHAKVAIEMIDAMLAEQPAQRKPLTDEEIWDEVKAADLDWQTGWSLDEDAANRYITFARAIEAAHGIKGDA